MGEEVDRFPNLGPRILGAAIGSLPGLGALSPVLEDLATQAILERARRCSIALTAAERAYGASREDIADHIRENPGAVPLMTRFLFAAGEAGHDEILSMIGNTFAAGLKSLEQGDEVAYADHEVLLRAIENLTPDHVGVLLVYQAMSTADDVYVRSNAPVSLQIQDVIVADLIRNGLIKQVSAFGQLNHEVTSAGVFLLQAGGHLSAH